MVESLRNIIDPRGLDALEWLDYTTDTFSEVIPVMKLRSDDEWRTWGYHARRFFPQVPDPDEFDNWSDWADRFNQVMYLVRT